MPIAVRVASLSLVRLLGDKRDDLRRFIVHQHFTEEIFLESFRRAHQDVFGMVEVTTLVEFIYHRMKSAVYKDWTDSTPFLRKCILEGFVCFGELRGGGGVRKDLTDLWSVIRTYIRYTVLPYTKEKADRVSRDFLFDLLFGGGWYWTPCWCGFRSELQSVLFSQTT